MDEKKLQIPHGAIEWNAFLIDELQEMLGKDARVTQDERFTEASPDILLDWIQLCRLHYWETDSLLLNIYSLTEAHFEANEYLRWTKERDERIMESFSTLKALIIQQQGDEKDHSHVAWLRCRPFHSNVIVQPSDHLNANDFTVRTYGVLMRSGIKSISQLKSLSEEQIQSIGRLGARSRQEVLDYRKRILQVDDVAQTEERDAYN